MKINILQYLPERTKISLDVDIHKKLFGKEKLTELCKLFQVSLKNFSRYKNKTRAIPLGLFYSLLKYRKISLEDVQNNMRIKVDKNGEYLKFGPFLEINPDWIYIAELLKGDGHITPNYWYIQFVNKENSLIEKVENFFKSIGLPEKRLFLYEKKGIKCLTIRSYVLARLFDKIFGVTPGNKSAIIDIPDFVIKDQNMSIAAVRGAFDAEGSITFTGSRRISISSTSKVWIFKLKKILNNLRITSIIYEEKSKRKSPIYRILIHGIVNIKRFSEIIRPEHKKRKEKLEEVIKSYWKNPEYIFHKAILESIREGINRRREISDKLKVKLDVISNNIYLLRKKGFIEPSEKVYSNSGSFFKYKLTKKGKIYLAEELIPLFN